MRVDFPVADCQKQFDENPDENALSASSKTRHGFSLCAAMDDPKCRGFNAPLFSKLGPPMSERCSGAAALCLNVAVKGDLTASSLKVRDNCSIRSEAVSMRT